MVSMFQGQNSRPTQARQDKQLNHQIEVKNNRRRSQMAIKPLCDMCENELTEYGAIVLSPPNEKNMVRKFHLCVECYRKLNLPKQGDS